MKMRSILAVLALLLASWRADSEFVQLGRNTYYIERVDRLNYFDAWNFCAVNNMHLISIETDLQSRLLSDYLKEIYIFWTSANELAAPSTNSTNRAFVWAGTGSPLTFTNWAPNEPNNDLGIEHCVVVEDLYGNVGSVWSDRDCQKEFRFICQF